MRCEKEISNKVDIFDHNNLSKTLRPFLFALPKLSSIGEWGILGDLFKIFGTYSRCLELNFEKYTGHRTTNEMGLIGHLNMIGLKGFHIG